MSNATVLQTAANRFSRVAGFAPIVVDGKIGSQTLNATRLALAYIKNSFDVSDNTIDNAALWLSKIRDTAALVADAGPVGQFLNNAAEESGLPYIAAPIPVAIASGGGIAPTTQPPLPVIVPQQGAASIVDAFRRLPTWQKIILGALVGVGAIWAWGRFQKSRGLAGAPNKLYLYTYRNKHGSYSDVWAHDVEHAREQIQRRKDRPGGFYSISRVTNVPAREVA